MDITANMMNKMMERMIKNMSVAEKEAMMIKMMPAMMADMDIGKMMPGMMAAVGSAITPTSLVSFLSKALKEKEFKEFLGGLPEHLPALGKKMQIMMSAMKGVMPVMMSGMMNFMGNHLMPVMMPMMHEMMPVMMKETMPEIMKQNETMKHMIPGMMTDIMPECVEHLVPMFEQEKKDQFLSRLSSAIGTLALEHHQTKEEAEWV